MRSSLRSFGQCCGLALLTAGLWHLACRADAPESQPAAGAATKEQPLPSVDEARRRAEILHETFHATLQAVHLQYFRDDERVAVPAATLRSVFRELSRRQGVELRWLAVNAQAMNKDHEPASDFEKDAARQLAAGAKSHEQLDAGTYRRVGAIVLESECLKCHQPTRMDTRPRTAGLVITMPVTQ
jgi:cytochrome c5